MKTKLALLVLLLSTNFLKAQTPKLTLDLSKPGADVSLKLFGLMTEEINHSYDGGLYAELIRNRIFKDNPKAPNNWSVLEQAGGKGNIQLDTKNPVNNALTVCLKLVVEKSEGQTGVVNEGYWGIPVKPQTSYKASFYAKGTDAAIGPLSVSIESNDGATNYATAQVVLSKGGWKKYSVTLTTASDVKPTTQARFVISTSRAGTYWFNLVSLFPPTFNNRPNGNRQDIMQLMADMKPAFLRLPGGNYLEGDLFSTRFPWKATLGPIDQRAGHPGCWGYRSSDGMGLLEYLEWCEDLKIEPVLAVFAGYVLKGDYLPAGPFLKPFVDEALEEIEYVSGDVNTKWGAVRAKDGHPKPFKLNYIEIGNEDGFDASGSYDGRFAQFYDAIKAKYPKLQLISTIGGRDGLGKRFKIKTRRPDVIDEHYYRSAWEMEEDAAHYDDYDRKGPKIFVGEWATREGSPTPNMNAALGDAAWMTGMERNADHVIMSCYAPLFVNVNPGGMQWSSDLIGYNAISSYGSPSYYAEVLFGNNIGNKTVPVSGENIPTQTRNANKKDSIAGTMPKPIPALFYVASKDTKTGTLYIKVVNTSGKAEDITIDLKGISKVSADGVQITLKGSSPGDTNTITEPDKIVPHTSKITGLGKTFTKNFDAYSINVIKLQVL
ncbi:alpha-L-arabinofuranosidase C-terminal domain-containing protein [Mucilaginibacter paludis]|uniref:non-reducing end alpha-L-arabinofuranosidase n=1 Tax=Mucilaginibacter paludis DSM 18603 TaxID=714943 RepID=H1Y2F0_9SPHI|nr:alpha-L-arabinofuranosidase C-terminal domain-containing protein [Mucilaginibacter paludis]EHQ27930.1 alpha-L-arabinofuranosidase domain protein [Mucilaginibacter paludis DSM 18603]